MNNHYRLSKYLKKHSRVADQFRDPLPTFSDRKPETELQLEGTDSHLRLLIIEENKIMYVHDWIGWLPNRSSSLHRMKANYGTSRKTAQSKSLVPSFDRVIRNQPAS